MRSDLAPPFDPDLTVSRDIEVAPADAYAAVTDVSRMGEWSPETHAAAWNDGYDHATVGARYTGHNRNGDKEWSIEAEVVDCVENERFFFDCNSRGFVFARWGYTFEKIESSGDDQNARCRVTEYWKDLRPPESHAISQKISGVEDRMVHNRAGMEATLERLATALEA